MGTKQIRLETNLLGANNMMAVKNRRIFKEAGLLVINLMSSPGSGKTTLLEKTIEQIQGYINMGVIEGDLYTDQDALRIQNKGVKVVQINTEGTCHLDAGMVEKAWRDLGEENLQLLFIENVGNLVCPAEFDLGEDFKAVILSTTEGNDKVLKYPLVFQKARVVVLNKIDLLPYVDFDLDAFERDIAAVNPDTVVFKLSGRTGEGIEEWTQWLTKEVGRVNL